jgi:hypothetical protein
VLEELSRLISGKSSLFAQNPYVTLTGSIQGPKAQKP